ncbi:acetyl-CoA C-acetyltransferase [Yaniella flava]|uniref:Probable acetyl-CoA acetyltransferase n=1 Tax=Yaniella flava TaxID=287930 RepID=A0ABN2UFI8_9MICC
MSIKDDSVVLLGGARTPFGRFGGKLSSQTAQELGAVAIAGALANSGVRADLIDQVIMGQVLPAGGGQLTARSAAAAAGVPMNVPALNINRMCLSGVDAIMQAQQAIFSGHADVVVAGGQESMSNAPHLLTDSRRGVRYGSAGLIDHLEFDGLQDAFTGQSMGSLTEADNVNYRIGRSQQDALAARSHQRAAVAAERGTLAKEIVPVTVGSGAAAQEVAIDEGIRPDTTEESLARLPPVFAKDGTLTAGNSSPISDGAAAVVVARRSVAKDLGLPWLVELGAGSVVAGPDSGLHEQPANALMKACEREGLSPEELDLVEINEAFAAVVIASQQRLGLSDMRVNVSGGAIALGHPIGTSGARLALHLANEIHERGKTIGALSLCGAGGQGQALILRAPE